MKRLWLGLFLLVAFVAPALAIQIPDPTGYVVDTTNTLSPKTVAKMTQICKESEHRIQMAVLFVDTIAPVSIEEYGIKVAEKWTVGYKGQDNGIILIVVKKDRKIRIEVGRGVEGNFPDFMAGKVIDAMKPMLAKGHEDWDGAMMYAVRTIQKETK